MLESGRQRLAVNNSGFDEFNKHQKEIEQKKRDLYS